MRTSSAKNKGRAFQKKVAAALRELFSDFVQPDDIGWCSMGAQGEDIKLSPKARKYIPISIECKHRKAFSIYEPFEQAKKNAKDYQPVLFIQGNYKQPLVVCDMDFFLNMLFNYTTGKDHRTVTDNESDYSYDDYDIDDEDNVVSVDDYFKRFDK